MKVIHIVATLDKGAGGPSRSVPQTCEYVSKLGVEVEIYARPSTNSVIVNETETFKVKFKNLKELLSTCFLLSKKEIDLIHLQQVWDPYVHLIAWFARLKKIPYIITPRGMLEPWILAQRPLKKKIGRFLYVNRDLKKANAIHVTCELEKNNVEKLGFETKKVNIPNGIILSSLPTPKTNYNTKKIVFLSRIHEKKGIELLLDAWKVVSQQAKDWSIEIAGEGSLAYISKINKKIETEKIERISLVGGKYGNDKWDFIKSGNAFVLPTYSENFGIVVAEALAVGVPVVTTKGTPWEELNTKDCGWWIELSVINLIKTLKKVVNSSESELKKKGEGGIALVKERYDILQVARKVKKMYEEVIDENKR